MARCFKAQFGGGVATYAPTNYDFTMAEAAVTGLLQGTTITLDAPVPPLDGQRVHVVLSSADEPSTLSREDQVRLWDEWARNGPQGAIEDDEAPEFP